MRDQWYRSDNEIQRLTQGGVRSDVIDAAVTSFILQTIVEHGPAAERLCNKVQIMRYFCSFLREGFKNSSSID